MRKGRPVHLQTLPAFDRREAAPTAEMGVQAQGEGRQPDWCHDLNFNAFLGSEAECLPLHENTEIGSSRVRKQGGKGQYPKHRRQPHLRAAASVRLDQNNFQSSGSAS